MRVEALSAGGIFAELTALSNLLRDTVQDGASIGFVWPMHEGEAEAFWRSCVAPVTEGNRVLLIARDDRGKIVGSGQLDLATRANGRHRAEVMKLMVHPTARLRGIGRALMQRLEEEAKALGRTTLILDTVAGNHAERLYQSLGWIFVGGIPDYAVNIHGVPEKNAIYYKLIGD